MKVSKEGGVKETKKKVRAIPGKTPAKPSAFSINSSIGKAAMDSSFV